MKPPLAVHDTNAVVCAQQLRAAARQMVPMRRRALDGQREARPVTRADVRAVRAILWAVIARLDSVEHWAK